MKVGNSLQRDGTKALIRAETHNDRERVYPVNSNFKEFGLPTENPETPNIL
jgi:hypothetical protein